MLGEQSSAEETRLYRGDRTLLKIFVGEIFLECNHWMDHADSHTVLTLLGIRKDLNIRMPQSTDRLGNERSWRGISIGNSVRELKLPQNVSSHLNDSIGDVRHIQT